MYTYATLSNELENPFNPSGSRMVPLPGLHIYLQPRVIVTFNPLNPSCCTQWPFIVRCASQVRLKFVR